MDVRERPAVIVACPAAVVALVIVVIFVLVLVALGADPVLALGSFAVVAGAAARMLRR
jgi:hypothetical protein